MTTIPGAYPVDLATPDEPAPVSHSQSHHHHQHHDRNKLHKSADPRGHKHVDSGVGIFDSEPIQSSKAFEPKPSISQETGTEQRTHEEPSYTLGSESNRAIPPETKAAPSRSPKASEPKPGILQDTGTEQRTHEEPSYTLGSESKRPISEGVDGANSHHSESSEPPTEEKIEGKTTSDETAGNKAKTDDAAPPYWGSLPKAIGGGIYNTVMGHGSSTDDHAQHHNIPQRSAASERSHVTGDTTDYPRGGIYNSVAGHGSNDEESKRHDFAQASENKTDMQPRSDTTMLNNTEQKETSSRAAATQPGQSGVAPTILPETSMRDDVLMAGNLSGYGNNTHSDLRPEPSASETMQISRTSESGAPRAFPLTTSHEEGQHRSSWSDSRTNGYLAGAAVVGAGAAAAEKIEKPKKLKKQKEASPSDKDRHGSKEVTHNNNGGAITSSLPHKKKEEKEVIPTERKKSREEGSPTGEKKHHKILGIFHRHKDEDTTILEPTEQPTNHHSSHKKQETAAAATAGAGAYGLMHHRKDDKKANEQRSISEPASQQADVRGRSLSGNETAAASAAESAGGFGLLYQKPEEHSATHKHRDPLGNGSTPPPPARSNKRHSHSPISSAAPASDFSQPAATSNMTQNYSQPFSTDKSKVDPSTASGVGLAVGLGAYQLAGSREQSRLPGLEHPKDTPAFENPREPPSAPLNTTTAMKANTKRTLRASSLSNTSSTPVPTAHATKDFGSASNVSSASHMNESSYGAQSASRKSADYSVLPSGTTSGVKSTSYADPAAKIGDGGAVVSSKQNDDSEPYNFLPSGTPSGVKVKPRTPRSSMSTDPTRHSLSRGGDAQYNTLASGMSSGSDNVNRQRSSEHPKDEMKSTKYSLSPPPIPAHTEERKQEAAPEAKPELLMFPTPEQAQEMSPEVLPAPYTASAPRSSPSPKTKDTEIAPPVPAKEPFLPAQHQDVEQKRSNPPATDPALAAATGAWTANGGAVGGNAGSGKVVHKCEHCGGDNDISSYFTKEALGKMDGKNGAAGGWWHNAWNST
ncbi:hypothetical protein B0T25DRAFT_552198 [Lasiosphaeria hispida]|uniref:Uncharacterized protein n=1 Tax=Lasiosphaeria hispida TaxID=260671 RepID=A0AAJ0HC61_9PEZI|nr:hypothetical protein B0T25DRAFT_552198 [Lasiosphaeria hispida]